MLAAGCGERDRQLKFSGTLEMTEHQLGPKAAGRLVSLTVEESGPVQAGQLIATLDRYEQAKKDFERLQGLFRQGGADRQQVEHARLAMEDQQIVSPVDGVVLVKVHETGESVMAGAPVVVVGDTKDRWVKVFVPAGIINRIRVNDEATLAFDGTSQTYRGRVRSISPKAEFTPRNVQTPEERVTQNFAVKIALDDVDARVHPGVDADVTFNRE